ncbi:isopentenyl-diphosphate delta-isomerase, type 1, partial [Kipferlia bialata]|eukprot:g8588.t1
MDWSQYNQGQVDALHADNVILVSPDDVPLSDTEGLARSKLAAHTLPGSLHRAFSVFFVTPDRKVLLQRRALSKITFPGLWANTCCSHPLYLPSGEAETVFEAARRRLVQELGLSASFCEGLDMTRLCRLRYRAEAPKDALGRVWVEHE